MPESHRRHLEWSPGRLVAWGEATGPAVGALSYRSVDSILKTGLDGVPLPSAAPARPTRDHGNVRGPGYYE